MIGPPQDALPPDPLPEALGVLAGVVLLAVGVLLAPLARWLVARVPRRVERVAPAWGLLHVIGVVLFGFLVLVVVALVPGDDVMSLLLKTHFVMGAVATLALLVAVQTPGGLRAMGVATGGNARAVATGVLAYAVLLPGLLGVLRLWPILAERLGIDVQPQAVLMDIVALKGTALVLACLLAVVVQPLLEEIVFRGFIQPVLVRRLGAGGGVVAASLLFALLHGTSPLLPIFVLSLLLGWVQLRTGRITASWAAHALHNGLVLALVLTLAPGEGA